MKRFIVIVCFLGSFGQGVAQEHLIEVRAADSKYRYIDWFWTGESGITSDLYYIGVPGNDEFDAGIGFTFELNKGLLLSPIIYATLDAQGQQLGAKLGLVVQFEKAGWKANGYLAHYWRLGREVPNFLVLDPLQFTRTINKHIEFGISMGFFHQEGEWNPLIGPRLNINDHVGTWGFSFRGGSVPEFRVGRTFVF